MTTHGSAQNDPQETGSSPEKARDKRPYKKPEVRHERVSETVALSCSKQRATRPHTTTTLASYFLR
jgi:hypothetical protein